MKRVRLYTLLIVFVVLGIATFTTGLSGMAGDCCKQGYLIAGLIIAADILRKFADRDIKYVYTFIHHSCFMLFMIIMMSAF